jgi:hypothetical protein
LQSGVNLTKEQFDELEIYIAKALSPNEATRFRSSLEGANGSIEAM